MVDRLTARHRTPLSQPLREQRARDAAAKMDAAWRARLANGDLDDATFKALLRRTEK